MRVSKRKAIEKRSFSNHQIQDQRIGDKYFQLPGQRVLMVGERFRKEDEQNLRTLCVDPSSTLINGKMWEQEAQSGTRMGTMWEQSENRAGTQREQEPHSGTTVRTKGEHSGNKNPELKTRMGPKWEQEP